ncbi:hypothetical protein KEM56_005815 [Ascosphaera pollenicola]|nr:hypothetical protein KEM56_005815 [Ascosphaera pollenicola]
MKKSITLGALLTPFANLAIASTSNHSSSSSSFALTWHAADVFTTGIEWNDGYWDDDAGYLITATPAKGHYDIRHTGWYATQLLARNRPGDVERAIRIFDNVIDTQYLNPSKLWYGGYQLSPSVPEPGTAEFADVRPYKTWDPNFRVFIACAWVQAIHDYEHLLPNKTVEKVKKSLHLAAKGDLYRVGGSDGDNLYPAYSNPWIMRTIVQAWVGHEMGDKNLTNAGEKFAQDLYDLWSKHQTLSEFNSGTYSGVAMWALALWTAYAPEDSKLRKYGAEILTQEWKELGELYNPNLKNVAGPWDRSYGFNMQKYANLVGAIIWGAVGRDKAPVPKRLSGMYHADDFSFFPLIAMSVPEMVKYLPDDVRQKLTTFSGEHTFKAQALSPPFDEYPRNITAWLSENVTIGAETIAEKDIGGPAKNENQFNPAVIQWAIDDYQIGCLTHFVSQSSIDAVAAPKTLNITYPNATEADGPVKFEFLFSGLDSPRGFNVTGLEHLPGLKLSVETNASPNFTMIYDTDHSINEFAFYNITYTMPEHFKGRPYFSLMVQ